MYNNTLYCILSYTILYCMTWGPTIKKRSVHVLQKIYIT